MKKMDIDFFYDFAMVKDMEIEEKLTEEEIQEGIEPFTMNVKVCITSHVLHRKEHTYGRQFEWYMVEDLLKEKGHKLFNMKNGDEFAIVNDDRTLALICKLYCYDGELVLVLKTVIRNVIVDEHYQEHEKKVWISRRTKCI